MSTPTANTPGYGIYAGVGGDGTPKNLVGCGCLLSWLPVLNQFLVFKKLVPAVTKKLWVEQLTGLEPDSAGVHAEGGAFDLGYTSNDIALTCREMGAPATWVRLKPVFDFEHTHGVLSGCAHNSPAKYQITEQLAGGDGLVGARPDPLPDPLVYRNWVQGKAYALGVMSPTAFQLKILKVGLNNTEVAKFQRWLWSKQPADYKTTFRSTVYNFDVKGYTGLYGPATARVVTDTYRRLHKQYPTAGWATGVVGNVWPDEPGTKFVGAQGGTVYI